MREKYGVTTPESCQGTFPFFLFFNIHCILSHTSNIQADIFPGDIFMLSQSDMMISTGLDLCPRQFFKSMKSKMNKQTNLQIFCLHFTD